MSDWLERELSRELAPVTAPPRLKIRLGLAPAKRWELPRLVLALATAVIMVIGGGYAANRTAALDLRREGVVDVLPPAVGGQPAGARLLRCDGGAGMRSQVNAGNAGVLLAHAGSAVEGTPGFAANSHGLAASEAGCHFCHTL